MSFQYETQFGKNLIIGRAKKVSKNVEEARKCHQFSLGGKEETGENIGVLPRKNVKEDWIFGPACLLDRTLVYPCSRYRCSIPCPCKTCNTACKNSACKERSSDSCACSECIGQFNDHSEYHHTYHIDCKFCENILSQIPNFNFWFLNSYVRVVGEYREHFNIKDLAINTNPKPEKDNPNKQTWYASYDRYVKGQKWAYTVTGWFVCEECNYKVGTLDQYREHIALNHTVSKRFFHCYLSIKHTKGETFNCSKCEAFFTTYRDLSRHALKEHYHESYKCNLCPENFTLEDNLLRHKRLYHWKARVVKCSECEKTFSRIDKLNEHYEIIHEQSEYKFCDDCGSSFSDSSNLKRHKKYTRDKNGTPKLKCSKGSIQ